ncbi:MAG: hypothetical protein JW818_01080, partial [Pirellulales bacterium]|nr:hypothetical protein [Pirellulales bacterium]
AKKEPADGERLSTGGLFLIPGEPGSADTHSTPSNLAYRLADCKLFLGHFSLEQRKKARAKNWPKKIVPGLFSSRVFYPLPEARTKNWPENIGPWPFFFSWIYFSRFFIFLPDIIFSTSDDAGVSGRFITKARKYENTRRRKGHLANSSVILGVLRGEYIVSVNRAA